MPSEELGGFNLLRWTARFYRCKPRSRHSAGRVEGQHCETSTLFRTEIFLLRKVAGQKGRVT